MGKKNLSLKDFQKMNEEEREELLLNWEELDEEEQFYLKEAILYNKYGTGGEYYSIIPNMENRKRENKELNEHFNLPKVMRETLLEGTEKNGSILILPIDKHKTIYTTILLPNKTIEITPFKLKHGTGKFKTQYTEITPLKNIRLTKSQYLVTNLYSNMNKSFTQGRTLSILYKLGGNDWDELEEQKKGNRMVLSMDIEGGKTIYKKSSGETFETLEEILKRKPHPIQKNIDKIIKSI